MFSYIFIWIDDDVVVFGLFFFGGGGRKQLNRQPMAKTSNIPFTFNVLQGEMSFTYPEESPCGCFFTKDCFFCTSIHVCSSKHLIFIRIIDTYFFKNQKKSAHVSFEKLLESRGIVYPLCSCKEQEMLVAGRPTVTSPTKVHNEDIQHVPTSGL